MRDDEREKSLKQQGQVSRALEEGGERITYQQDIVDKSSGFLCRGRCDGSFSRLRAGGLLPLVLPCRTHPPSLSAPE